jgi:hypothetical protein
MLILTETATTRNITCTLSTVERADAVNNIPTFQKIQAK